MGVILSVTAKSLPSGLLRDLFKLIATDAYSASPFRIGPRFKSEKTCASL